MGSSEKIQFPALQVAIDGPSGVGKSTLGKALARRLGYQYIDSGALYRAVGRKALDTGAALDDPGALAQLARESSILFQGEPDHLRVLIDGCDLTSQIRLPDASRAASVVATVPAVREAVVDKLREMSRAGGVVMDGRDIGTRVLPSAQVKLFLYAETEVSAHRRWREDLERGRDVTLDQVRAEIEERDRRDRERKATPLVKADDAILIDTSSLTLDQLLECALEIVKARG